MKTPRAAMRAQKYASRPYPNGCRWSGGRALRRWASTRNRSLAVSASEWAASAAIAGEAVTPAATTFARATATPDPRATHMVREVSSPGIRDAADPCSLPPTLDTST